MAGTEAPLAPGRTTPAPDAKDQQARTERDRRGGAVLMLPQHVAHQNLSGALHTVKNKRLAGASSLWLSAALDRCLLIYTEICDQGGG